MARTTIDHLPPQVARLLDGADLQERVGLTFLLSTTDESGWPHMAMLSVGELVAIDSLTLRAALWLQSSTSTNLTRTERGLLSFVAEHKAYSVRITAVRGPDLELGEHGQLAQFTLQVQQVVEDAADYAELVSGVTFRLLQPEQVIPRWERTVAALRARTPPS
jgi:hypothetical protein